MKLALLLFLIISLTACATKPTRQASEVLSQPKSLSPKAQLNIPFVKQDEYFCAPASVSMLFKYQGLNLSMNELAPKMMSSKAQGSFPFDVVSAVRRNQMLPILVKDFRSLLTEISSNNPVMVFQNLGLDSVPIWHYAVVTGYDIKKKEIILHSGKDKNLKQKFYDFEFSWQKSDYWAMVIVKPGELSATGDDLDHALSAASLEQLGFQEAAYISYQSILAKWPTSLSALIGLGNVTFDRKEYTTSITYLELATKLHPTSAIAWHNLATAQGEANLKKKAKASAKQALSLADETWAAKFRDSLSKWL